MTSPVEEVEKSEPPQEEFNLPPYLRDDYQVTVLTHLRQHGSATEEELIKGVCDSLTDGECTDHERVRVAVTLQTETIPELFDADVISRNGDEITLEFLPAPVFEWLDTR